MKKVLTGLFVLFASIILTACPANNGQNELPRYKNVSIKSGDVAGSIAITVSAVIDTDNIYYIVTELEAAVPTENQVIKGEKYDGNTVLAKGKGNRTLYALVEGLEEEVYYTVYVVIEVKGLFSELVSQKVYTKNSFEAGAAGKGTEEDPYQIRTIEELEITLSGEYGRNDSAHYILMNDLDLAEAGYGEGGKSWTPLGRQGGSNKKMKGMFNGNGHTISNLYINVDLGIEKWGLFNELDFTGIICNLHLRNVNITASGSRIGAFVGYGKGTIYNVSVDGGTITQLSGDGQVGGIIGAIYDTGALYKAYTNVTIYSPNRRVGGIVGAATTNNGFEMIKINDVYSLGDTIGTANASRQIGGIIGAITGAEVARAYAAGKVTGVRQVGGIAGYVEGNAGYESVIADCIYVGTHYGADGSDGQTVTAGRILGDWSITKGAYSVTKCYSSNLAVNKGASSNSTRPDNGITVDFNNFKDAKWYQSNLASWNTRYTWVINNDFPTLMLPRSGGTN